MMPSLRKCGVLVLFALTTIKAVALAVAVTTKEPDAYLKTDGLIERFGYAAENHNVTTEDGYILQIFRIPHGRNENNSSNQALRTPVIIQHGLLCSSDDWVINSVNESLGFMLADAGFDVWISNFRGNRYGLGHTAPVPSHHEFFQFSWDDMADYDLPAVIDYVLQATGYKDLQYIGHSMGTTTAFAMLSSHLEYNQKVRHFHALAPVGTLAHTQSRIRYLAPYVDEIQYLLELMGADDFLPNNDFIKLLAMQCNSSITAYCEDVLFLLCGYDPQELNATRLPVYLTHSPAGTSTKTVIHYAQEMNSGYFRRFDYGYYGNYQKYGQFTPPEYAVEKITTAVSLYWGDNDLLADRDDVTALYNRLHNVVDVRKIGGPKFSHLDFLWGIDDGPFLNEYVISKLERY